MTKDDFNRWWTDYATRFPDTGKWLEGHANKRDILSVWLEALETTNLSDALEVNRLLTRGELERWKSSSGYHEREETPAMIRKMVWELARNRGDYQEHQRYERPKDQPPSKFPIGILFRQLVAVNERWAKNPDFDKQAEHKRLQAEFLAKYSTKPLRNTALDSYNREPAQQQAF